MLRINYPESGHLLPGVPREVAIPFDHATHSLELRILEPAVSRINQRAHARRYAQSFRTPPERRSLTKLVYDADIWISRFPKKDDLLGAFVLPQMPTDLILTAHGIDSAARDPLIMDALLIHELTHLNGAGSEDPAYFFDDDPARRYGLPDTRELRVRDADRRLFRTWPDIARNLCGACRV